MMDNLIKKDRFQVFFSGGQNEPGTATFFYEKGLKKPEKPPKNTEKPPEFTGVLMI
jgi:hypothetical protein